MNNVYFACRTCQIMTDAGYRWAYCHLEAPGIVTANASVSVPRVLSAKEYWAGSEVESSPWLRVEILPVVREFLATHREHDVIYAEHEGIVGEHHASFVDWLEVGAAPRPTPRWFADVLCLRTWPDVIEWVKAHGEPWWWRDDELKDVARVRFGELVKRRRLTTGGAS